mmetsp:Transcript_5770/g.10449  ORF Transcript_5770/g.10449 Transcript_5770/m.10449 type:complete len:127 (+) Transcript_5770:477-857(+)
MVAEFETPSNRKYKTFFRSLYSNIGPNNPTLKSRILSKEIPADQLVRMKPEEFASEDVKKQREKNLLEKGDAARSDWDKYANVSDAFKCGKCKKRQCSYTQIQIRSSDEPMTTKVICLNCGNRWNC